MNESDCIVPEWPAPARVRVLATTRAGGVSAPPFDSLNLGLRSGDSVAAVAENRRRVAELLPAAALWLRQEHGTHIIAASAYRQGVAADGCVATRAQQVCAVLTADCLPVLLCDRSGTAAAALHAGWRGLCAGIVGRGVAAMPSAPGDLIAWLGPAIGAAHYRVGDEFRQRFLDRDVSLEPAFIRYRDGWHADSYALARHPLTEAGVTAIHGGDSCTFAEPQHFYAHRRDGTTGRQATLVWLDVR